jgi:FtsH-binding integral membrane protein
MSQMEDDASRFLKRVVWSLSSGLVWLIINLGIGIYAGWMVPEKELRLGNILFYIWMLISLGVLVWINYRIWKEKFPHG